jgi:hypothetical protein
VANVKGSALGARFKFVEKRYGGEGLARLLRELAPEDRAIHDGIILPAHWYPFGTFVRVIEKIDALWGKGDLAMANEMARDAADANLTTLYRFFYSVSSVSFILGMAARLWRMNYDAGELTVQSTASTARLGIVGWPDPHRAHCLSVMGWSMRSAELSGALDVKATETGCRARGDATCEYVLTWK